MHDTESKDCLGVLFSLLLLIVDCKYVLSIGLVLDIFSF